MGVRQEVPAGRSRVYDAIVVGSGISGGWAAKELTEKGLDVLLLERGRPVEHGTDYVTEHQPPWQTRETWLLEMPAHPRAWTRTSTRRVETSST